MSHGLQSHSSPSHSIDKGTIMTSTNIYPSTKALAYVYLLTHKTTNEFYYGYRAANIKTNTPSHIDLPIYKTSSNNVSHRFNEFNWIILAEFFNPNDAYDFEQLCIHNRWKESGMLNMRCYYGTERYDTTGRNKSDDEIERMKSTIAKRTEEDWLKIKEKLLNTLSLKPQEEKDELRRLQVIKSNETKSKRTPEEKLKTKEQTALTNSLKTAEEKAEEIKRKLNTCLNRSSEEKENSKVKLNLTLSLRTPTEIVAHSKMLSDAHQNRSPEDKLLTIQRHIDHYANLSEKEKNAIVENWKSSYNSRNEDEKAKTLAKWHESNTKHHVIISGVLYYSKPMASKQLGLSLSQIDRLIKSELAIDDAD